MGIKDNFTQAMKELTNPRPSDARKEVRDVASYMNDTADAQPTEPVQAVQNTQPSENEQPEQQAQDFSQRIARDMNEQYTQSNSFDQNVRSDAFTQTPQNNGFTGGQNGFAQSGSDNGGNNPFMSGMRADNPQEMTVISKNTMIDGNVRSFADMKIDGNIKGNVETTKNITINGKVVGDLTCDNISMKNSAVQGNVRLKGQAVMANDSMLIGDLSSQVAQLNGKIKGNIEISGKIMLDRDSVIIGDIKAGSIAISDGAVINGFVTTTYLSKDESANIFPENIALGD
ncbi:MAG: polymer-forming cytoskeletal protein [[Eubacterium] siraeum]|nr:polymer-forming cytoskeletal protein [[Eubacterium] siraeum]